VGGGERDPNVRGWWAAAVDAETLGRFSVISRTFLLPALELQAHTHAEAELSIGPTHRVPSEEIAVRMPQSVVLRVCITRLPSSIRTNSEVASTRARSAPDSRRPAPAELDPDNLRLRQPGAFKSGPVSFAVIQSAQSAGEKQPGRTVNLDIVCRSRGQHVLAAVEDALLRLSHRQVVHTRSAGCHRYIDAPHARRAVTRREPAPRENTE
jgi:hypothetical protein